MQPVLIWKGVTVQAHNKSRQQGGFAPGPLFSGLCLKRYVVTTERKGDMSDRH